MRIQFLGEDAIRHISSHWDLAPMPTVPSELSSGAASRKSISSPAAIKAAALEGGAHGYARTFGQWGIASTRQPRTMMLIQSERLVQHLPQPDPFRRVEDPTDVILWNRQMRTFVSALGGELDWELSLRNWFDAAARRYPSEQRPLWSITHSFLEVPCFQGYCLYLDVSDRFQLLALYASRPRFFGVHYSIIDSFEIKHPAA